MSIEEHLEEVTANRIAENIVTQEQEEERLKLLDARMKTLGRRISHAELMGAEEMTYSAGELNEIRKKILELQGSIDAYMKEKVKKKEYLQLLEQRIESLEAIFPANPENN